VAGRISQHLCEIAHGKQSLGESGGALRHDQQTRHAEDYREE
jgi:hypothetical protein